MPFLILTIMLSCNNCCARFFDDNFETDLPDCSGGDRLRLVCMGKGYLTPDSRTLEDCQIPVFKTHPTPINISVKPEEKSPAEVSSKKKGVDAGSSAAGSSADNASPTSQGCGCVIL